ncbi:UvrD-helicase domain-containing protein [Patescibacteria group bacterium]|nr:UvrD-helicase domain-containing protein [Patescibacteria group bacterium]MBU1868651.1 UvrD-helicase domain-containing protein [Patescibacteria group bacterium]
MHDDKAKFKLNPEQHAAITHSQRPLLIIAGAGTGKTTVITERIKWLIEQKSAKPSEILALTFTEKAAQEMEERVDIALPIGYVQTWISTFHSFCERVLRQEAIHIGLDPVFRILSQAENYLFIKKHIFEFNLQYYRPLGNPAKFISGLITHFSRLRNENITPEEYSKYIRSLKNRKTVAQNAEPETGSQNNEERLQIERLEELATAYKKYQELKIQHSVMDFADLLYYTLKLFKTRSNILVKYQKQFKHVLVDEFQDTNYIQNEIAVLLAGDDQNITAVCDDDQSIYRWRGAAIYNVLSFQKHFPNSSLVSLIRNYRSPQIILDRAYHFIQHNNPDRLETQERIDKKLRAVPKRDGSDITLIWEEKVEEEAESVIGEIQRLTKNNNGLRYQDFAILVRANNHAFPFLQALSQAGLPYQFLGPGQLFHQPEIKDLIAYLTILSNIKDDIAMYRVLTKTHFNVNTRDIAFMISHAKQKNLSLFETLENIREIANLKQDTYQKISKFISMIHRHLKLVPQELPGQILYYFLKDTGLLVSYQDPQSPQHQREIQNISKFFDVAKKFEIQNPESNVYHFVEYLSFIIDQGESPLASEIDWRDNNAVNILTFHSAKGLEFPVVFMVNLVTDRFPTRERKDQIPVPDQLIKEPLPSSNPHIAEERRLFYVGITRAQKKLYFSGAKFYHQNKRPKRLSPFITETLGENLEPFRIINKTQQQTSLFKWYQPETPAAEPAGKPLTHRISRLSYSQINTYSVCPQQYKYKHILGIPTPPTSPLSFGESMHRTLAEFYRRHMQETSSFKSSQSSAFKALKELLETYWISEGYQAKEHEARQKKAGIKMLKTFCQNHYSPKQIVNKIEFPFSIKIGGIKITGRIDRVDKLADGTIEIIDYKTGKAKKQKEIDKDLQLGIYSLAAADPNILNTPPEKQKLSFIFLEESIKLTTTRNSDDLQTTKTKIGELVKEIRQGNFTPNIGLMCQYCSYQLLCPAYKVQI